MDFKNFIDILSTPKNIGSNKWVLNNFSDLTKNHRLLSGSHIFIQNLCEDNDDIITILRSLFLSKIEIRIL